MEDVLGQDDTERRLLPARQDDLDLHRAVGGEEDWDPAQKCRSDGGAGAGSGAPSSGFGPTFVNVTKCFVGAASFELPWAFMQAGTLGSLMGVGLLAAASSFSLTKLAQCGDLVQLRRPVVGVITYPQLGREAMGTVGWALSLFGVVAMTLGVCGSYFVFISSTLSDLTSLSTTAWLAVTLAVVSVLSWLRHLRHLAFTSLFGILALVLAVIVTSAEAGNRTAPTSLTKLPLVRVNTYGLFLGNAGFLYLISTAILPVYQNMTRREQWSGAFNASIVFVTVLNLLFGLFCWVQFGDCGNDDDECVQSNVIDNLSEGPLSDTVKVLLCVDLLFTALVFLFPVNQVVELEFGIVDNRLRNLSRTFIVLLTAGVAFLVPSFGLLTGLTGGFGNNILGFILPPLFYYQLQPAEHWRDQATGKLLRVPEQAALLAVFVFGVFFLVLSTYSFGKAIADEH